MNQNTSATMSSASMHDGYLSEEAKRKFSITAGILGAAFFFLQMFAPFFAMMLIFPALFLGAFQFREYDLDGAAVFDNHLYFFVEDVGPSAGKEPSKLMRLDLSKIPATEARDKSWWMLPGSARARQPEPEEVAELSGKSLSILANGKKLLVLSGSEMWELRDGKLVTVGSYASLGNFSRPFYYEGLPAVVQSRPNALFLDVFRDGEWDKSILDLKKNPQFGTIGRYLQVVTIDGASHVFLRDGKVLFHRVGFPSGSSEHLGDDWQTVGFPECGWRSFVSDGKPAVLLRDKKGLSGVRLEGGRWSEFFKVSAGPSVEGFFPLPPVGGHVRIAVSHMPFSFAVYSIEGNRLILNGRIGRGFPFPPGFMAVMFVPHLANLMFPIILAFILSGLMLRYRVSAHSYGGETAPYASLIRRAFAQVVDGVILVAGMLPFIIHIFHAFDTLSTNMDAPFFPVYFLTTFLLSFIWPIILLFVFSATEGIWGITPGKWLLGIRVVGTDLKPCGFWRALLRNFLKVVDGFFNFMVGILIVAFTKDWQRVGDMAARTIVIRRAPRQPKEAA